MPRLAWGLEEPIGRYLSAQFPELMPTGEYEPQVAAGFVDDDGVLFGAAGLRWENPWDAQLSIYAERPGFLSRRVLRILFERIFGEWGLQRVTCHVATRNHHARKFVERLGFKLEGVKRRGFDGKRHACIYGLVAGDCKWIKGKDNAGTKGT